MLRIYSVIHDYTSTINNSPAYTTKTYNGKHITLGTFVSKHNFTRVHFSDKKIGSYETLDRLPDVTYCLLSQDGVTYPTHRKYLIFSNNTLYSQ